MRVSGAWTVDVATATVSGVAPCVEGGWSFAMAEAGSNRAKRISHFMPLRLPRMARWLRTSWSAQWSST